MVNDKQCSVCGYEMEEGPRDYNICPSCGTEFGLHDVNSTIEDLRQVWLASGPRWYSSVDPQPENWNPIVQLARLLFEQAAINVMPSNFYAVGDITPAGQDAESASLGSSYRQRGSLCRSRRKHIRSIQTPS